MKRFVSLMLSAATVTAALCLSSLSASADYLLRGDVNHDGNVTLRDASLAQKMQLSESDNSGDRTAADMDGNGKIAVMDAYLIQRFATLDYKVLEGDAENGIDAYARCRSTRLDFYNSLNQDRVAHGISPIKINDAALAAGQELCDQWYIERNDPNNTNIDTYSKTRTRKRAIDFEKSYDTVFEDYGYTEFVSRSFISAAHGETIEGSSYYDKIKTDVQSKGTSSIYYHIYNDILMGRQVKAICVGERETGAGAIWIITGYY